MKISKPYFSLIPILMLTCTLGQASDEPGPSATDVQSWIATKNRPALDYHWAEFNPKEKKQVIEWISTSPSSRAPEWKPIYQKEIDRLVSIKNPPEGTSEYALKILQSLDNSGESLSYSSKLYLNWFASKEIFTIPMDKVEAGVGKFLSAEGHPELAALRKMDRKLDHELELNLISAFQSLKANPSRPSIENVSTLMRYGYDPLRMNLFPASVHAEMLNYATEIQNLASVNQTRYLSQYSVNASLKVEKQSFRPLALERFSFTATQAKPVYESAAGELAKIRSPLLALRNQIYYQARGGNSNEGWLQPFSQDELHAWIKQSPAEVKSVLKDLSVAQIRNPNMFPKFLDPLIYEMRSEFPEELSKLTKELIIKKELKLTEVSERLWFSEASLKPFLRENLKAGKLPEDLHPILARYEATLGKDPVYQKVSQALSESSLSSAERESFSSLLNQNAAGPASGVCGTLGRLRNFFVSRAK